MQALRAVTQAENISADVIIVIDQSGCIAHEVAMYRPRSIILVVTDNHRVARQCHLHRGILPVLYCLGTIISIKHDLYYFYWFRYIALYEINMLYHYEQFKFEFRYCYVPTSMFIILFDTNI